MKKILASLLFAFFANQACAENVWACKPWSSVETGKPWGGPFLLRGDEQELTWVDTYGDKRILKFVVEGLWYRIFVDARTDTSNRNAYYVYMNGHTNLEMRMYGWDIARMKETECSDK